MPDLPKAYTPHDVEGAIYERWLAADVFAPDGAGSTADPALPPFTIIQPPPNVTGSLHLGHAQRTAVEDLMVRHARMRGHRALFLPGLDHASIAAQFVLDGILAREGESRQSLGRDRYLERMREFVATTREVMLAQQRRVGASADWGRLRYTMDDGSARAVRVAFERLYRADLAYRTEALVNWCPGCRTSVSDLEVVSTPETGTLWSIRYHLIDPATGQPDPAATITVATTRPETILGDTAVAVHPDDERYAALVGRLVRIPFVDRDVPIIADEVVDRAFGTGAVKITPAHDHDDYQTGLRHGLAAITVLADDATITGTGTRYDGLDRFAAREAIVADLDARGDLAGTTPHELVLGRCQRSNDVIEPRLKTQWFIRTTPLAERALSATREGRTRILPERFEKTWEHWLTNIRDWNVSRQLWWGHRIPAWYCPDGHVTVTSAPDGPDACAVCGRPAAELRQDPDIFDTWFSSGLWPFSTLGWPDETPDLATYYPTSVMETGYDILFFWVARMMMLGLELTDVEPFHTVYLSGLIRDPLGQKMSKTKGNVVDPLGVIDESGADALRFALIHGATPGNDQRFGTAKLEHARNFANKLWNATRYVVGARPDTIPDDAERRLPDVRHLGPAERWLRSRAAATTEAADAAMASFTFGELTRILYDAIWSEYCDWGLEFAKIRLTDRDLDPAVREATWWTLVEVLDTYLRLLHPVMPFVTEALWAALPAPGDRPGPAHRRPLAWGRRARRDRRGRDRRADRPGHRDPQRACLGEAAGGRLARDVRLRADRPGLDLRGAPTGGRAAGPRPSAPQGADTRSAHGGEPAGDLAVIVAGGEIEAAIRPATESEDAGALERARLERELADAEGWLAAARDRLTERCVRVEGAAGGRRRRPGARGGARRSGRSARGIDWGVERAGGGDDPPVQPIESGQPLTEPPVMPRTK